jgi:hypothetical protein
MTDASCFHNLRAGGIVRDLAAGVTARVFPGVNAMLSVVTLEPHSESPVHSHANEQRGVDSRCVVLDIFAPPREEYRQAGSGLGRATLARGAGA